MKKTLPYVDFTIMHLAFSQWCNQPNHFAVWRIEEHEFIGDVHITPLVTEFEAHRYRSVVTKLIDKDLRAISRFMRMVDKQRPQYIALFRNKEVVS